MAASVTYNAVLTMRQETVLFVSALLHAERCHVRAQELLDHLLSTVSGWVSQHFGRWFCLGLAKFFAPAGDGALLASWV